MNIEFSNQHVELLYITPNAEKYIEKAGRTCYKSENKITNDSAGKFCKMLIKNGHEAMIEHAYASFKIITNRAIQNEIVRHRLSSFAVESTRWINYNKKNRIIFIIPQNLSSLHLDIWKGNCIECAKNYELLIKDGVKPEIARSVLPLSLKTEMVMTTNLREWRHFIKLRTSKQAHPEIQMIANDILKKLYFYAPSIFEDLWFKEKN